MKNAMSHLLTPHEAYFLNCQAGAPVEILLGDHQYEDCRWLGICRMFLEGMAPTLGRCRSIVPAYLRMEWSTQRLSIHFLTHAMSERTRRRYFADDVFRMPSGFNFSPEVVEELGLPAEAFHLTPGSYPILDMGQFLTISVPVAAGKLIFTPHTAVRTPRAAGCCAEVA